MSFSIKVIHMCVIRRILKLVKVLPVLFFITCSTYACANGNYDGKWDDNGNRITRLGGRNPVASEQNMSCEHDIMDFYGEIGTFLDTGIRH